MQRVAAQENVAGDLATNGRGGAMAGIDFGVPRQSLEFLERFRQDGCAVGAGVDDQGLAIGVPGHIAIDRERSNFD